MKIFVTGGSGFIGQSLLPELVEKRQEVYALGNTENCIKLVTDLGAKPINGDLRSIGDFKSELQGMDAIIYCSLGS